MSHPPIGSLCSLPSISPSHLRFNTTREVSSKEEKLPSKPASIPAFSFRISRHFDMSIMMATQLRIASGTLAHSENMPYASWMTSYTSNRTPPPIACIYPGITRTRNFCKICTTVPQYPGYGYNIFIPARNFCKFCTLFVWSFQL